MPLEKDSIHDAPLGLSKLVDKIWKQPCDRVPIHGRWVDSVSCARSVMIVHVCGNQYCISGIRGPRSDHLTYFMSGPKDSEMNHQRPQRGIAQACKKLWFSCIRLRNRILVSRSVLPTAVWESSALTTPMELPIALRRKRRGAAQPTPTETTPAESAADAATTTVEEYTPSGIASPGQRTRRHPRPESRPRYREGRHSYRTAPCAPAPAGPA
eukprot:6934635-Pyramimonas_sp.AAC.1